GGPASPVQAGAHTASRARLCSIWNSRISNSGALAAADALQDLRGHGRRFAISATAISDYDSGGPIGQVLHRRHPRSLLRTTSTGVSAGQWFDNRHRGLRPLPCCFGSLSLVEQGARRG